MRRAAAMLFNVLRVGLALVVVAVSSLAHAWKENTDGDLPWLGSGGRAHFYRQESSSPFSGTGYKTEQRWGRSSWSGEDPYITVNKAMGFLDAVGALAHAPPAGGAGSAYVGGNEVIQTRALPYRFTVVMIEPTVVVMNFDLVALTRGDEPAQGQIVGSARVNGWIRYGTRVPATGTLLWFSPEAKQAPTPVAGQATGQGEISVKGVKLKLERRGEEWVVTR
jgi:hypothetical protein